MKAYGMTKTMSYIGAGVGLVLFALVGLLYGSFLGGILGLNIAGTLFGMPVPSALAARLIVGVSMLMGVLVAGVIFIAGSTIIGWLAGYAIDSLRAGRPAPAEAEVKH